MTGGYLVGAHWNVQVQMSRRQIQMATDVFAAPDCPQACTGHSRAFCTGLGGFQQVDSCFFAVRVVYMVAPWGFSKAHGTHSIIIALALPVQDEETNPT